MGVVYRGLDITLEREVAVKLLHPHLADKADARGRLLSEARAAARLKDAGILEVLDVSTAPDGRPYLVTEYVRGRTLREVAEANPLRPPEVAAAAAWRLALALGCAHKAGVIHRDVKPENVLVGDDGALKLMDFGVARLVDRIDRFTQDGALVGSPAHMAPELLEGADATPASDVFGVGTLLYWLATGVMPFEAPTAGAVLRRIVNGAYEPPQSLVPSIDDGLARLLDRCLATDPLKRPADGTKLAEALGAWVEAASGVPPDALLRSFLAEPAAASDSIRASIHALALREAELHLNAGRKGAALARLDRVLADAPELPEAQALLERISNASSPPAPADDEESALAAEAAGAPPRPRHDGSHPEALAPPLSASARGAAPPRARRRFWTVTAATAAAALLALLWEAGSPDGQTPKTAPAEGVGPLSANGSATVGPSPADASSVVPSSSTPSSSTPSPSGPSPSGPSSSGPESTEHELTESAPDEPSPGEPTSRTPTAPSRASSPDEPSEPPSSEEGAVAARTPRTRTQPSRSGSASASGSTARTPEGPTSGSKVGAVGSEAASAMALPVLILVRPFARVEIENGPSSLEPSTRHSLRLPPGEHRVTVTCDVCEPVSRSVKVAPGRTNRFNLAAQIQRSELSFEVSPPGAWIRIGDERRTAEESLSRPFTVESPPGALSHAHRVEYEIALEGYAPIRRSLRLPAGERLTIAGRLSPL